MASKARPLRFVYYCSGHEPQPVVHIVSSAPRHVFADSIALGAYYRNANIDPVIVQPLAYRVDRQQSVEVLRAFLEDKDEKILDEEQWLRAINADCVLSDAAFLGCAAANAAGIPSVLITNFSFDSVYSYLSTSFVDQDDSTQQASVDLLQTASVKQQILNPDTPITLREIEPLVEQILEGYRCADLLLRLPGAIPIPSFPVKPALPSPQWVDLRVRKFHPKVIEHLTKHPSTYQLLPPVPFPSQSMTKTLPRNVIAAPLIVRSPDPAVYTSKGRSRLLDSIGVPSHLHDPSQTKVLLVSFGGQIFHKPHSRSHSRTPSAAGTPHSNSVANKENVKHSLPPIDTSNSLPSRPDGSHVDALCNALRSTVLASQPPPTSPRMRQNNFTPSRNSSLRRGQLRIPGAPTAAIPASPTISYTSLPSVPTFTATPPTPRPRADNPFSDLSIADTEEDIPQLFPDDSWIAIVCGVPKDWGKEDGEELPGNFFVAPKDVYMPDLTAVADVLLGKLGYGTVSECVDSCTPFVFVPRPLFIEEFGLRMLLEQEGVGVELSRTSYESGEWARAVEEAWMKGKDVKVSKREVGETGKRKAEGLEMANTLVEWVQEWHGAVQVN
ncbi:unnamed protein product [Somion occarium]|uniref:Uncharacterized protein n=1 Tax=Somion occarium TaxID=3059160 RepID=A0ABP1ECL4_9APHY